MKKLLLAPLLLTLVLGFGNAFAYEGYYGGHGGYGGYYGGHGGYGGYYGGHGGYYGGSSLASEVVHHLFSSPSAVYYPPAYAIPRSYTPVPVYPIECTTAVGIVDGIQYTVISCPTGTN